MKKRFLNWSLIIFSLICFLCLNFIIYYFHEQNAKLRVSKTELISKIDSTNIELEKVNLKFSNLNKETHNHELLLRILQERDREIRNDLLFFTDMELYKFQNELDSLDGIFEVDSLPYLENNLENLGKRIQIQSNKYDSLHQMVKENISYLLCIPLIKPIKSKDIYNFSSEYGLRIDPFYKELSFHKGIDIAAELNTPVVATGWGHIEKVVRSKYGYGNHIVINHGYGYETLYAHLNIIYVMEGQVVKRGQMIGRVGSTGKSTGEHLHYEVYKNNEHVDPINHFYSFKTNKTKKFEKLIILK